MSDGTSISEAQNAVVDAVITAGLEARESADDQVEAILDNAEAAISEAQRNAEAIARAALQTELMSQFNTFKGEIQSWLDELRNKVSSLQEIPGQIATMQGQIAALATMEVSSQVAPSLSIQQPLEKTKEALEEVTQVLPASLENAVEESPVPEMRVKRKRWI